MCKIFNTVGSLNEIQYHLKRHNLYEFTSVEELIDFQRSYHFARQQIILSHTEQIKQEIITLKKHIVQLNDSISTRKREVQERTEERLRDLYRQKKYLQTPDSKLTAIIRGYYVNFTIWMKIWFTRIKHPYKLFFVLLQSNLYLFKKSKRFNYITANFHKVLDQSSTSQLQMLRKKKAVIDEINNSIYGAIGEQKVVNMLENLSDDYILINDFIYSFQPPLYQREENNHIKSVQIDHILVSLSGIFIIETKNWSEMSIVNPNLYSPVQQVKRANFALYKILTGGNRSSINLKKSHWGSRKIPIRNIIVFVNKRPIEEFQYVKMLSLTELQPYIKYFSSCFTLNETQIIADFLLRISDKRDLPNKLVF